MGSLIPSVSPYDLAVLCPSCPWPGVNLPEGWEKAPAELRFLYVLMLCIDTNFHLKNQMVSSYLRDLGLGIGWGYFVLKDPYDKFVLNHTSDEDVSAFIFTNLTDMLTSYLDQYMRGVCSAREARYEVFKRDEIHRSWCCVMCLGGISYQISKFAQGRKVREVACFGGNIADASVDRYAPMDYAFGSILSSFTELLLVIISYDIACQ
ncbi:hypothetical protein EV421DRAFT_1719432 [Armillaria borealis]|uniref:Uncharacterized protein n=1 Tax=Armillaria borealis TaxID=47425 RepID=A0AA39IY10_9AGAR|nr:hypothetical protein EV421DRAFT_1719432 [Armillaria borealis]